MREFFSTQTQRYRLIAIHSRFLISLAVFDIMRNGIRNRSFFHNRARTLKRGFRRERSKLRFRLISRRMLWLSSSVQTKLGVNLDFSPRETHWIAISIAMQCWFSRRLSSFPRAVWRISQVSDAGGAKYKVFQVDFLLLSASHQRASRQPPTSNALWNYPRAKRIRNKYLPATTVKYPLTGCAGRKKY